ncbi:hypothetical protein LTR36_007405 [Oleoguttula mirabilis]|uniref:Berberine/berberine-like domain-containing protein n=1 Tax=Oleoguttula mirabilis TaxID=1507867 RepID=A0AAV9JA73_9PEZI|nr:hypothetical protein LTR36_007405 [Oleoguttula mirabilis]
MVDEDWSNSTFQQQFPVGYSYPTFQACPPVNASAGERATGNCSLGDAPVCTVNATSYEHVAAGIAFAKKQNLRLVVRDTGHDLLGRSAGYGSLQVWIKYLRTGITYHETFTQAGSPWTGSAFTIGGADQVLQARVVLANGSLVTASPTENTAALFFAIRGGGPGTYGVVVETTVKAWPTVSVVAQTLAFAPLTTDDLPAFMAALVDLYQAFPSLAKAGWSGYGTWSTASAVPVFSNFLVAYAHTIANFGSTLNASQSSFRPTLEKLLVHNGTKMYVYLQYTEVPTYAAYYNAFSGVEPAAGTFGAVGSRFLDEKALTGNRTALMHMLNITAGAPDQYTSNTVEFFGAPYNSQIAVDGRTPPVSAVNPAWRSMVVHQIVSRGWTQNTTQAVVDSVHHDITYVKEAALKKLAPETGCYMNEADRLDPDWQEDFYGSHYGKLESIKREYDPEDVFYCPTCVGSERYTVKASVQLCRTG